MKNELKKLPEGTSQHSALQSSIGSGIEAGIEMSTISSFVSSLPQACAPEELIRSPTYREKLKLLLKQNSYESKELHKNLEKYEKSLASLTDFESKLSLELIKFHGGNSQTSLNNILKDAATRLESLYQSLSLPKPNWKNGSATTEQIQKEVSNLKEIISSQNETYSKNINSLLDRHLVAAARHLSQYQDKQALEMSLDQFRKLTKHYPRGLSPELNALESGAFSPRTQGKNFSELVGNYLKSEQEALALAKANCYEVLLQQAKSQHSEADYFLKLKFLKAALQKTQTSEEKRHVLSELQAHYSHSGLPALAYFSSLDCLAAGDLSHTCLYEAVRAARENNAEDALYGTLDALSEIHRVPTVYLQLLCLALNQGKQDEARKLLTELRNSSDPDSVPRPEAKLAKALIHFHNNQNEDAIISALNAYAASRSDSGMHPIANHALGIAIQSEKRLLKDPSNLIKLVDKLLSRNREDPLAWNELALLTSADKPTQIAIKAKEYSSVQGFLTAGDLASQAKDTTAAETFFLQALEASPSKTQALQKLASTIAAKDPDRARSLLYQALQRAPHCAEIMAMLAMPSELQPAAVRVVARNNSPRLVIASVPPEILLQVSEAQKNPSGFKDALLKNCEPFKIAHTLLQPRSKLLQTQSTSIEQVDEYLLSISKLLQIVPTQNDFQRSLMSLYEAFDPLRFDSATSEYIRNISRLQRGLLTLDPTEAYFKVLLKAQLVESSATLIQDSYVASSKLFDKRGNKQDISQSLKYLATSLSSFKANILDEVAPSLLQGEELLESWVKKASRLKTENTPVPLKLVKATTPAPQVNGIKDSKGSTDEIKLPKLPTASDKVG